MNDYTLNTQEEYQELSNAAYWSWKALEKLQGNVSPEDFHAARADEALKKCHELFAEREARLLNEEAQP